MMLQNDAELLVELCHVTELYAMPCLCYVSNLSGQTGSFDHRSLAVFL